MSMRKKVVQKLSSNKCTNIISPPVSYPFNPSKSKCTQIASHVWSFGAWKYCIYLLESNNEEHDKCKLATIDLDASYYVSFLLCFLSFSTLWDLFFT